jgi:hypothetical protein
LQVIKHIRDLISLCCSIITFKSRVIDGLRGVND